MKSRWRKIGNKVYALGEYTIMWTRATDYPWVVLPSHREFETLSEAKKAVKLMRSGIHKNPKDYCYRKIKKKFKVFPSRYAGFALARCRRGLGKNPNDEISFLYKGKTYLIKFSQPNNYPIIKGLRTYVDPRTVDSAYPTKYEKWKSIDPFGKLGKTLLALS